MPLLILVLTTVELPVNVCRVCVVHVEKARVLAASCVRPVEAGMVVTTQSDDVLASRHTLVELLMADHPSPCAREQQSGDCELETLAGASPIKILIRSTPCHLSFRAKSAPISK